jgi:hypothetical protein
MEFIQTFTWTIATIVAFYAFFAELSVPFSKTKTLFFTTRIRRFFIGASFFLLLMPFVLYLLMHNFYDYPVFRISRIKEDILGIIADLALPITATTLSITSRFTTKIEYKPIESKNES